MPNAQPRPTSLLAIHASLPLAVAWDDFLLVPFDAQLLQPSCVFGDATDRLLRHIVPASGRRRAAVLDNILPDYFACRR